MAALSDYVTGTITLTNGSADFTGAGTGWLLAGFKEGDTIIDVTGATEFMGVVATITANGAGTLTKAWEGPTVTTEYRMRYQADGARMGAQARNLIELLGDGRLTAIAGASGSVGVIEMLPGGGAQLVPKSDLISGVAVDKRVATLADRDAFDGQAEGFSVWVANIGDGRAATYFKQSATSADWSPPGYETGPVGPLPEIAVGSTTTLAPGSDATVTPTPITGGVSLAFGVPAGKGFYNAGTYDAGAAYDEDDVVRHNGSSFIALQAVPIGENPSDAEPPVDTAYWQVLVEKGRNGEGTVASIVAGAGIAVDSSDPTAPVVGLDFASQAEAEAGTDTDKPMNALATAQAIAALTTPFDPSELEQGALRGDVDQTSKADSWREQVWANIKQGCVLLASGSLEDVTSLDIPVSDYADFGAIEIELINLKPAIDGTSIRLRVSRDDGATFDESGYCYSTFRINDTGTATAAAQSNSSTTIVLSNNGDGLGSASGEGYSGTVRFNDVADATQWPRFRFDGSYASSTGNTVSEFGAGQRKSTDPIDAVRIYCGTGNIASGKYRVYGYV